jgi:hypothetical protein
MVDFIGTSHFYRIKQAAAFTADGSDSKENIMLLPADTLHIKFKHNDYYAKTLMIVMISK